MEKELREDSCYPNRQSRFRPSIRTVFAKLLLLVILAGSLVVISGRHPNGLSKIESVIDRFLQGGSCTRHKEPILSSNDDFRLVEVHRAGVGRRRNQVYQVLDVPSESTLHALSSIDVENGIYNIPSMPGRTTHLADLSKLNTRNYMEQSRLLKQAARNRPGSSISPQSLAAEWITRDINIPNVTSKHAITTIAKVASNAYIRIPETEDWFDLGRKWNETNDFGWDENGLRGHVFANTDNSTIIVAMKGTSPPFVGGSDTSTNDKINDNLLFSCCCARVSYIWATVCDCYTGKTYKCNQTCLENEVASEDRYYHTAVEIFYNVTERYPNAQIWLTGHSLGGALASLMGLTFGIPTVTFESPPERLASQRLHLPSPPGIDPKDMNIWHFGHTADPAYMGICTGPTSPCWYGGYAMESSCHTGMECIYDTVTDLGWRVSLSNHRIKPVISDVIERYNDTAKCVVVEDCVDCYQWDWVD